MILSPVKMVTTAVVKVSEGSNGVLASLPEMREDFRTLIKEAGFRWVYDRRLWFRRIDEYSGPISDRVIETAAMLLQGGFAVDVAEEVASRLQRGEWLPERKRWVIVVAGGFGFLWRGGRDENLWHRSHLLPAARYDKETKCVVVPEMYYAEVEGFAEVHGFVISERARERMEQAARNYHRIVLPEIPESAGPAPMRKRKRVCDPQRFVDLPGRKLVTITDLLPHQVPAVEKLLPYRIGALFMDMGTGKTRCAIELIARRQARISRVIWFCPVSLKLTIAAEIAKHTSGESVYVFDDAMTPDSLPEAFWYIVGTESMSSSDRVVLAVARLIDEDAFVVVDESSYIKGHASKRSLRITELGKRARYRMLLTGTPLSQGVEDLYSQMRFLSQEILGYNSFYSFANKHLEYSDKYPGMVVRARAVEMLAEKISPYTYQVTKAESLTLPDKLYDQVYCGLTVEQRGIYEQAKSELLWEVDEPDSIDIFRLFTALQQIVSGYWRRGDEQLEFSQHRLSTLETVLGGIPEGEKGIIWCKFVYSLERIAEMLPGCARYFGKLSERDRQAEIDRFRGDGCQFLVAIAASGGHGLTLNEAHYHVFYENEFKYANRVQAEDRSHRIGQTQPVTYIDIYSDSGIDTRIRQALEKKGNVLAMFRREIQKTKNLRDVL